jgi:tetratricopeptide (TPR) repeat protein
MKRSFKLILLLLASLVLAGVAGWWVLVNPDNPFTRLFQRKISDIDARIVIGPYPVSRDFRLLKSNHVRLIVSLLDPAIPYEASLLEKERELAAKHGMRLLNFPMSSILGRKFGEAYDDSAAKAAAAILATNEKVYLHCYLGLHRIQVVRDLLEARGQHFGIYTVRTAERDIARRVLDAADAAYQAGRYLEALNALGQLPQKELPPDAVLLKAWTHYRLEQVPEARALFDSLLLPVPPATGRADAEAGAGAGRVEAGSPLLPQQTAAAAVGAGYCALRVDKLDEAHEYFLRALTLTPENPDALGGLGLVHHRRGESAEAIRHLEAALRFAPDNQEFRDVLKRLRP